MKSLGFPDGRSMSPANDCLYYRMAGKVFEEEKTRASSLARNRFFDLPIPLVESQPSGQALRNTVPRRRHGLRRVCFSWFSRRTVAV